MGIDSNQVRVWAIKEGARMPFHEYAADIGMLLMLWRALSEARKAEHHDRQVAKDQPIVDTVIQTIQDKTALVFLPDEDFDPDSPLPLFRVYALCHAFPEPGRVLNVVVFSTGQFCVMTTDRLTDEVKLGAACIGLCGHPPIHIGCKNTPEHAAGLEACLEVLATDVRQLFKKDQPGHAEKKGENKEEPEVDVPLEEDLAVDEDAVSDPDNDE